MSWNLYIETTDVDGNPLYVEVIESMTTNLTSMWAKALPFLEVSRDFDGKICRDIAGDLKIGLIDILDNKDTYLALEPDNGWGNFEIFFAAYVELARKCLAHPSGKMSWSG